jgi:hypothetical protein
VRQPSLIAYRIPPDEYPETVLRRIAREEIGAAIEDIDSAADLHEAVHEVRKRLKRIRGLLRLFRPAFPAYFAENAWFRDEAARLSELGDATSHPGERPRTAAGQVSAKAPAERGGNLDN